MLAKTLLFRDQKTQAASHVSSGAKTLAAFQTPSKSITLCLLMWPSGTITEFTQPSANFCQGKSLPHTKDGSQLEVSSIMTRATLPVVRLCHVRLDYEVLAGMCC